MRHVRRAVLLPAFLIAAVILSLLAGAARASDSRLVADAYITNAHDNRGDATSLLVDGFHAGHPGTAFLKFDFPGLPAGTTGASKPPFTNRLLENGSAGST